MENEETSCVIELSDFNEVNEYLNLGWTFSNQYISDSGEYGQPSQRIHYVLLWKKADVEPKHTEDSSYLRRKRERSHLEENIRFNPSKSI